MQSKQACAATAGAASCRPAARLHLGQCQIVCASGLLAAANILATKWYCMNVCYSNLVKHPAAFRAEPMQWLNSSVCQPHTRHPAAFSAVRNSNGEALLSASWQSLPPAHVFVHLKRLPVAVRVCRWHYAAHQGTKRHQAPVAVAPHTGVHNVTNRDGVGSLGQAAQPLGTRTRRTTQREPQHSTARAASR